MTRFKGYCKTTLCPTKEHKERLKTGSPVIVDDNPKCPKCEGTLWREDSRKGQARIAYKCQKCKEHFTSKKYIIGRDYAIKLHPDKANPPWIFEAMRPAIEDLASQESNELNTAKDRHEFVDGLMHEDINEIINGSDSCQIDMRNRIDEAIQKHVSDDEIKEILRHVFYGAMQYDNTQWDRFIAEGEKGFEAIETKLAPTRGKPLKRRDLKP